MKPCNGYTIDVIVNLPIADLNCALIWSLSIVLKVNWNPTTGKIFFMSTCVYLIIFLANDLLPLYLTEKATTAALFQNCVRLFTFFKVVSLLPWYPSLFLIHFTGCRLWSFVLFSSITPFTVTYHESLFTALSVIQTFSKFRNPKVPFTGCKLDQFLLLKYLLSVCFSMRVFSEVHKKSSRMQIPLLVQCSTHSDSLFTQVFKGSAVNPSLGTS